MFDAKGNLYFGFIYPLVGPGHSGCLWRLDPEGELLPWYKSGHANSHIYIAPNPSGELFVLQRNVYRGASRIETQLWKLDGNENRQVMAPTFQERKGLGRTFLVSAEGNLIYATEMGLHTRGTGGKSERLAGGQRGRRDGKGKKADFERIEAMDWGPDGKIFVLDAGRLRVVTPEGEVTTASSDMFQEHPKHLPHEGMNMFVDLAVTSDGTAYTAYYGNRRVLRVSPQGEVDLFLDAGPEWCPLGVAVAKDGVYVMEVRHPAEGHSPRLRRVENDGAVTILLE